MARLAVALALVVCAAITEAGKFQWNNCAPGGPLVIDHLSIGPDPIDVPGDLHISLAGRSTQALGSTKLTVSMHRKTFLLEIPFPCISNVGSCTYDDICTIVDRMIAEDWMGVAASLGRDIKAMLAPSGIDASNPCPQPPRSLNITDGVIHLPEIPSGLTMFADGDYHIKVEGTDNASGQKVLCLDVVVTIQEAGGCTGLGCIFGRK